MYELLFAIFRLFVAFLTRRPSLNHDDAIYTTNRIWIHRPMAKCVMIGRRINCTLCFLALSTAVGCGDRSYLVDPEESSKAAIEQHDKKDKKLSREEIAEEIDYMYNRNSGLTAITCTVALDGSPLSGATVKFIPEKFLGDEIKTAQGITNSAGVASMSIPAEELPKELRRTSALRVGIYRVEITHSMKKLPAKYNTESELGFDFHAGDHVQPPVFNLVSK
jgi:hypothetical protein